MIKKWLAVTGSFLLAGIMLIASCKKEDSKNNNSGGLDRKPMLTNYADNYILPAYTALDASLAALKTKADAFTAAPDPATLSTLQSAWKDAYKIWQRTDLLEFGPAEDLSLRMYINTFPVTVSKLEANITSGSYDLETFGNKDAQGFPALDYLLNGLAASPAAIVTKYSTDAQAVARKKYLVDVIVKMQEKAGRVKNDWAAYRKTFIERTGTDVNGSISKMTNAFVLYYERYLRSGKIGYPVGAMTGVSLPAHTEAFYSPDLSRELAEIALKSVINFYEGKYYDGSNQGDGMKSYLKAIGTKDANGVLMAEVITTELNNAMVSLQALTTTIRSGVDNNRPAVLHVYEALQKVVALLKVDMVSAFGISITYVDNDGD